jgi:membrane-bound lytic murein transglycosylase B
VSGALARAAALAIALASGPLAAQPPAPAEPGPAYAGRPEVQAFIRRLVEQQGFVESELNLLFSRVQRADPVLTAIQQPAEKVLAWPDYRATFLSEERIAAGAAFWRAHGKTLERARQSYGVPPEYVVAIIGVETFYGRQTGRWRVVDALSTLAFDYPPRAGFFRGELEQFLVFAREAGVDVFSVRGSYAGAMGLPQFMPSSARRYAVDFDGDGHIDLRASPIDAIGSVANFLQQHGWRRGGAVLFAARVSGEAWQPLVADALKLNSTVGELAQAGVEIRAQRSAPGETERAMLVELKSAAAPSEFRVGLHNFQVITHYNRSAYYASAVADLARALRARHAREAQRAGK